MSDKVSLVRVLTASTGTSTVTLGARYSDLFMTMADAGAVDGRPYTYLIVDGNNWELGKGVYTASGTQLSRVTVIASRISGTLGTTKVTLSGTAQVRIVESAVDMDGVRGTRSVTGTSDTLASTDLGYVVTYSNAAAVAVSLAQAGTAGLYDGWATWVQNLGVGTVTITPATSTVNAAATLPLATNMGAFIWSDGTNYHAYFVPVSKPLLAASNLADVASPIASMDNLSVHGTDIASAATLNLDTATGNFVHVTGTTGITAITLTNGRQRTVYFTGALTLTNGASLVLPGGANITTAAGDIAVFVADGTTVRCSDYLPATQAGARALIGAGASNGATLQTNPSNPTGTASGVVVMMGLGTTCKITPVYSGRVKVSFLGDATNTSAGTHVQINLLYGTGSAPANGGAQTGTQIGNGHTPKISVASGLVPFSSGGIITGLTVGTTYWFDLAAGVDSSTGSVSNLSCDAFEF